MKGYGWGPACGTYRGENNTHWILVRKPEGRGHMKDLGVDGRIILTLILLTWRIG
jgi:hypothetical protein